MVPRLRETCPATSGSQDAGITQPRDHCLAHPCSYFSIVSTTCIFHATSVNALSKTRLEFKHTVDSGEDELFEDED